ncbi:MAG: di-trans,poly-cis-decaprenylcistransferase [Clostridia bacterium]|nr:di-trans,poly-cis-decaprenylcistransferase [Clostridia bacterium]
MAGKKKNTAPEAENEDLSRGVRSLAIIPDGNRRWARKRGLPAIAGHSRGARVLKDISRMCCDRGIRFLTFYAFSTENWKRSEQEVGALMGLLKSLLDDYERELGGDKGRIAIRVMGDRSGLSKELNEGIDRVEKATAGDKALTVILAINYGSRDEITKAVRSVAEDAASGKISPDDVTQEMISSRLYTAGVPDPDLLIRTSGEERISNYMLWQIAYSELYFADCLWPDFDEKELDKALDAYAGRKRRFGG